MYHRLYMVQCIHQILPALASSRTLCMEPYTHDVESQTLPGWNQEINKEINELPMIHNPMIRNSMIHNPMIQLTVEWIKCSAYLKLPGKPGKRVSLITDKNRQEPTRAVKNRQEPTRSLKLPTRSKIIWKTEYWIIKY